MDDAKIVELYWSRSEQAIEETESKYGKYCRTISFNILADTADAEECVNDTYLKAWNSMPSNRPSRLAPAFPESPARPGLPETGQWRTPARFGRACGDSGLRIRHRKRAGDQGVEQGDPPPT